MTFEGGLERAMRGSRASDRAPLNEIVMKYDLSANEVQNRVRENLGTDVNAGLESSCG